MPLDRNTFISLGLEATIPAEINGRRNGVANDPAWDADYLPCPEAEGVAESERGNLLRYEDWSATDIYAGTRRLLQIYVPKQAAKDASVIFFNDGSFYLSRKGPVRATHVLDYLISNKNIRPTIAVFINPGVPDQTVRVKPIDSYGDIEAQRSLEYDRLTPDYGNFLFQEVLPFVESETGLQISENPENRTVCGISSGGIAAFTTAWQHPDWCTRVLSHCGSFTNIWGGHNYPAMIRSQPRKPIRVFLTSNENDADTPFGNWALANKTMAGALDYAGYDYRFEFGHGGHSLNHGGSIFADSLRWLAAGKNGNSFQ